MGSNTAGVPAPAAPAPAAPAPAAPAPAAPAPAAPAPAAPAPAAPVPAALTMPLPIAGGGLTALAEPPLLTAGSPPAEDARSDGCDGSGAPPSFIVDGESMSPPKPRSEPPPAAKGEAPPLGLSEPAPPPVVIEASSWSPEEHAQTKSTVTTSGETSEAA